MGTSQRVPPDRACSDREGRHCRGRAVHHHNQGSNHQEATMVTRASGSQSTKTVPRQGQNKPASGGTSGAGKDRGTAKLPTISRTTAPKSR
jgi:hypothetical protein